MAEIYVECYPGAPEEYSKYVNNKEALPKAAFQYGVKMADDRKTKRTGMGKRGGKTKWSDSERDTFYVPEALKSSILVYVEFESRYHSIQQSFNLFNL
ncbi:hypothetical protein NPIL_357181 [Nephila pilipes]|uniref:Protein RED C-terminal domain-containing protein n=1 Tax=Nephila pilipes TaxID=299642 RepID=A0A8X6MAI0_NEPPI|nr:hypothetical protein NPIL_357181 [Nephila pilipes]